MFDSRSRVWVEKGRERERQFFLQQSHEAVSHCMAAQHTETHTVQAQYIIVYGTYATLCTLWNRQHQCTLISLWCIKASKPTAPSKKTVLQLEKNTPNKKRVIHFPSIAASIFTTSTRIRHLVSATDAMKWAHSTVLILPPKNWNHLNVYLHWLKCFGWTVAIS